MFLLSAFFYQLQLCMRRTPSIFGCAKSSDVTTNFIYINTMSNVMVKAKKIFLSAKLVLGGKMFGKGERSPDIAETSSRRDFRAMMYYEYRQGKSFRHLKCVNLLLGPVFIANEIGGG